MPLCLSIERLELELGSMEKRQIYSWEGDGCMDGYLVSWVDVYFHGFFLVEKTGTEWRK